MSPPKKKKKGNDTQRIGDQHALEYAIPFCWRIITACTLNPEESGHDIVYEERQRGKPQHPPIIIRLPPDGLPEKLSHPWESGQQKQRV